MTISFVLNDEPGQVSEETRERVLRIMREMGYRPRIAARRPREAGISTIGIASGFANTTFVDGGYSTQILSSLLTQTQQRNLNVLLFHPSLFHSFPHKSIRTYLDGRCEGLILVSSTPGMPLIQALSERGVPFVLIGNTSGEDDAWSVDVDNIPSVRTAINHLVELGHKRIAYVGGPDFVRTVWERRDGYRLALEANGIPDDPELESGFLLGNVEVYGWVAALMRRKNFARPTAFFCWNDEAALRTLTALTDLNLRVPEQVSIVGFDDLPSASAAHPGLTTLRQPYREIGAEAVEILMNRFRTPENNGTVSKRLLLPARLIVRDSSAPPASSLR